MNVKITESVSLLALSFHFSTTLWNLVMYEVYDKQIFVTTVNHSDIKCTSIKDTVCI